MEHKIDSQSIGLPQASAMEHAISTCVHCGFCLPACPTYQVLGEEMDSPRGRIVLMRGVLEQQLPLDQASPYIDRCLGCLGCVTACPSGVPYGELIASYREYAEGKRSRSVVDRISRSLTNATLPYAKRFRWAVRFAKLGRPVQALLPRSMQAMLQLAPSKLPPVSPLPALTRAKGTRRGRVGLFAGCVQQSLEPEINLATIRVLAENGFDVVVPESQSCCGALGMHTGKADSARELAARNFGLFPDDLDAIITNAAGCGSGMKEYKLLFQGHDRQVEAVKFSSQVQDVCEFLDRVGLRVPQGFAKTVRVAYHDACHLAHAQGIVSAPRQLLRQIEGVELLEIPSGEICCGSAGTYNIEQPEIADQLGRMKAQCIAELNADVVALGNIGCMVQIRNHLAAMQRSIPVVHTVQLLDQAYSNQQARSPTSIDRA
jgi:glycolate oxidase iron-sulfur subunit